MKASSMSPILSMLHPKVSEWTRRKGRSLVVNHHPVDTLEPPGFAALLCLVATLHPCTGAQCLLGRYGSEGKAVFLGLPSVISNRTCI